MCLTVLFSALVWARGAESALQRGPHVPLPRAPPQPPETISMAGQVCAHKEEPMLRNYDHGSQSVHGLNHECTHQDWTQTLLARDELDGWSVRP